MRAAKRNLNESPAPVKKWVRVCSKKKREKGESSENITSDLASLVHVALPCSSNRQLHLQPALLWQLERVQLQIWVRVCRRSYPDDRGAHSGCAPVYLMQVAIRLCLRPFR